MFEILKTAKRPVLWFSGGLDSTLVLTMLREQPIDFDIVQSRDMWTKEQRKRSDGLIKKWNLKVFSYAPAHISLMGDGDNISAVFEYAIGGTKNLVVKDLVGTSGCYQDLPLRRSPNPPFQWDLHIVGSRKDDRHYSRKGSVIPGETWQTGNSTIYAPLYNFTREDVKRELRARGLDDSEVSEVEDTGNLQACTACLKGKEVFCPKEGKVIQPVNWQPEINLSNFRQAFA